MNNNLSKIKDSDFVVYFGCFICDILAIIIGFSMIIAGIRCINLEMIFPAICIFVSLIVIEIPFLIFHNYCAEKQADDLWGLNR